MEKGFWKAAPRNENMLNQVSCSIAPYYPNTRRKLHNHNHLVSFRSSLAWKIGGLVIVPFLGFFLYSLATLFFSLREMNTAAQRSADTVLVEMTSELIGHLQKERGKSGLFLAKVLDIKVVQEQQAQTDISSRKLFSGVPETPQPPLFQKLTEQSLSGIEAIRESIRSGQDDTAGFGFYTETITRLLDFQRELFSLPAPADQIRGHDEILLLESVRERVGRLRGRLARILSVPQPLSDDDFWFLLRGGTNFHPDEDAIALTLDAENRAFFDQKRKGPHWALVRHVVQQVLQNQHTASCSIDSLSFFHAVTSVLDDLEEVIRAVTRRIKNDNWQSFFLAKGSARRSGILFLLVLLYILIVGKVYWKSLQNQIQTMQELQNLDQEKQLILRSAGEGIFGLDKTGAITFANETAEKILGVGNGELLGKHSHSLFHFKRSDGSTYPEQECPLLKTYQDGEIQRRDDEVFWRKEGTPVEVEYISTPIPGLESSKGAVVVFRDITERKDMDRKLREANQSLKNAKELELRIGFQIQKSLLFGAPPQEFSWMQIAQAVVPSQGIDGDFFDFLPVSPTSLDMMFGDVMGKGIPAALIGAAAKSHIRQALIHFLITSGNSVPPDPAKILQEVQLEMYQPLSDMGAFFSLLYARFDGEKKEITVANCGHPPLIFYDSIAKEWGELFPDTPPLGIVENPSIHNVVRPFHSGDLFIFYSDGITEARRKNKEFYGENRFRDFLKKSGDLCPEKMVQNLLKEIREYLDGANPHDDLTCVIVKIV